MAVVPHEGDVAVFYSPDPWHDVASIRAIAAGDRVLVAADTDVVELTAPNLVEGLTRVADILAVAGGVGDISPLGPAWCSWYCYWGDVTEADIVANLDAMQRLDLEIEIVQVDDGHQAGIGDWLERSPRFGPLQTLGDRIAATGRRAGLWTAPFAIGMRSRLAQQHPDWLVRDALALENQWDQAVGVLDVTHPDAAEHLVGVFRSLREAGFSYHKVDFVYAGAMPGGRTADCTGLDAYGEGVRLIREGLGEDATILACGAPLLPSIGRVDAMRVSPDIDPRYEPNDGDLTQPGQRSAVAAGRARAWMHGRLWTNDPDCLIVRAGMERREQWARYVQRSGGLVASSDPLDGLDEAGLELLRRTLRPSSASPLPASDVADALQAAV